MLLDSRTELLWRIPAFVDPLMELCGLSCIRWAPTGDTERKRHRLQLQLTPPTPGVWAVEATPGLKLPRLLRLGIYGTCGVTPPVPPPVQVVAAPGGWRTLAACHGHSQTLRPVRHSRIEVPMCRQTVLRVFGAAVAETDMPKTLDGRGGDVDVIRSCEGTRTMRRDIGEEARQRASGFRGGEPARGLPGLIATRVGEVEGLIGVLPHQLGLDPFLSGVGALVGG